MIYLGDIGLNNAYARHGKIFRQTKAEAGTALMAGRAVKGEGREPWVRQ